ncbi:hypothetical protein HDU91_006885 [Kappamyces sp. JEL0680]|nr:hypothetical protein HDU91_006885 [Kappamyces sp. JEL0680]
MLACHVKGCKNGYPLELQDIELEEIEAPALNESFLKGIVSRLDWNALVASAVALGMEGLPEQVSSSGDPEDATPETLQLLHTVLLEFVDQAELEAFDKVSTGKYTIGLGQTRMACVDDVEDINSICLTVVQSLLEKYNIEPSAVGRLEVGTETIIDKSKSVKSVLMQLFGDNTSIEGVDTTNACYGGTNALFNCINWLESSYYDGRYAIAVAADIAVYKNGGARPTGGAGAVAILLGRNAPLVFDQGLRATHVEHVYDFYKPDLHSEYPEVDGPLSNKCYTKAVDVCYQRYIEKLSALNGAAQTLANIDHVLFHSPYTKLVQKSYGRMAYNDFLRDPTNPLFEAYGDLLAVGREESYTNKEVEKTFMAYTKSSFNEKAGLVR